MLFKSRSHHPTEEELSAYIDGELASGPMTSIAQHLRGCEACAAHSDSLGTTKSLLAELPRFEPSRSFVLSPELARERPRPAAPRRSPFVFAPAVALTVFLALVAVDLSSVSDSSPESSDRLAMPESAAKAADDAAGAPVPAARDVTGQAASSNSLPPTGGAGGESQTFGAPATISPVPSPGQPGRTAGLPPATGQPQAAGAAAPPVAPAVPQADASSDGVASSTATERQGFSPSDTDSFRPGVAASDGETDWLRLLQIGAFVAFVVSLVVAAWSLLRSKGRT
ncbi:MAG: hypothetical protein GEU75_06540 [Dehalococcoidia bacterium]|nr:hypothetical protein [Dehalococcoidia bacterium]